MSAAEPTGEVPGFADRLGERLVVPQPSGALLEYLFFHPELTSAAFFEPAVKARLKRLSNFRHAAYARASRFQRDPAHGNRLALVSAYAPGRRLADVMVLARRGKVQPRIAAVLSLIRQLMTGVALLHDYAPDVFHGAVGPERLVIGPDGRLVITEYVLGAAVEQAVAEWGTVRLWRDYRLATLGDTSLARFGRRIDLVQIGLVTLTLLVGRPLTASEFPDGLTGLLDHARETSGEGESAPLGATLREWLSRLLSLDPATGFRTLFEAQKAFGRMVDEEPRYGVSSVAVETFFQQCEEAALLPVVIPDPEPTPAGGVPVPIEPAPAEPLPVAPPQGPPQIPDALPSASVADPFGPWPVVVGSDTVATLFETFKPQVAVRESHVVAITDESDAPEHAPPAALVGPVGEPPIEPPAPALDVFGGDGQAPGEPAGASTGDDWIGSTEAAAARQLREALFDFGAPPPVVEPARDVAAALPAAPPSSPADVLVVPTNTWSTPPSDPAATGAPAFVDERPAPAETERTRPAERAATERRAPAVLSYDQVHRPAAKRRWRGVIALVGGVLILGVAGVVGGPKVWSLLRSSGAETKETQAQAAAGAAKGGQPGGFKITTQPAGCRITIDGVSRGTAPLRVEDLAPGLHSISVQSDWGTVEETVTVEAGKVTPLALATIGWIKIAAPVDLHVSEDGKSYGVAAGGPVMVPAGRHHFDLVNQGVAVRLRQFVDVPPGQTVNVPVELPLGMINLTSDQPAQVLVDGQVVGDTPLMSVPATLGQHEVIFRSPKYGDVNYTVNVTLAAPVRLTVTFNKR